MKICKIILLGALMNVPLCGLASEDKGLLAIADFADRICGTIVHAGESSSQQIKGKIDAEIPGLLKKLANLGASGDIEAKASQYSGLLQTDLAGSLAGQRDCKQRISDRLLPAYLQSLPKRSGSGPQKLLPGTAPTPINACAAQAPAGSLIVLWGSNSAFTESDKFTLLKINGQPVIGVSRNDDDGLSLNMDVASEDGRLVAKIRNGDFNLNFQNIYNIVKRDPHSINIVSLDGKTTIDLELINPQTLRVSGTLYYGGHVYHIADQWASMGGARMAGNCFAGSQSMIVFR